MKKKIKKWLYKEINVELLGYRYDLTDGTRHYEKRGWTGVGSYRVPQLIRALSNKTMHDIPKLGMVPNNRIKSIAVIPMAKGKAKIRRSSDKYDTAYEYVEKSLVYGIENIEGM